MWGMPFDPRDLEAAERGEIHLGGCLVFEGMPAWHCNACGHEFGEAE